MSADQRIQANVALLADVDERRQRDSRIRRGFLLPFAIPHKSLKSIAHSSDSVSWLPNIDFFVLMFTLYWK